MSLISGLKTATDIQLDLARAAKARRLSLNITQQELSQRSGVSLATLKRFEKDGSATLATLLAVAEALDTLEPFDQLFPAPDVTSLDELDRLPRQRARS